MNLYTKYVYKEPVENVIKEKHIKLKRFDDKKQRLMDLINAWKNIQDKSLKIYDIKIWHVDAYFQNDCEPWQAKIIYTFDV